MSLRKLPQMVYDFQRGPVPVEKLDLEPIRGNCRLAVQYYFHVCHGIGFEADEILCPRSFRETGRLVDLRLEESSCWTDALERGDVLFAERIVGKDGEKIDRPRQNFESEDLWITSLHSAVFLGRIDEEIRRFLPEVAAYPLEVPLVWHATAIAGGTCVWTIEEFSRYYRVVSARRFLIS